MQIAKQSANQELLELAQKHDYATIRDRGFALANSGNPTEAAAYFRLLRELNPADLVSRYMYVRTTVTNNQPSYAAARDELLKILDEHPHLFTENSTFSNTLLRSASHTLIWTNQFEKAREFLEKLVALTNAAEDYDTLKDVYSTIGDIKKELWARKEAARLKPETYGTPEHLQKIQEYEVFLATEHTKKKVTVRRYPTTEKLKSDLPRVITDDLTSLVIANSKLPSGVEPCVFVMGGCWHRDFGHALRDINVRHHFLPAADEINTCAGNLMFAEWLHDPDTHYARDKFAKLIPDSAEVVKQKMRESNIIVLTYTRAFELFDASTQKNVLGELSIFTLKALTEKYQFGLSSVEQNVRAIVKTIQLFRKISPDATIAIQISPTPLFGSAGAESPVSNDFLSKAMLRISINEVITKWNLEKVIYWPTIEAFRWVASHQTDFFGGDDGSAWHVSLGRTKELVGALVGALSEKMKTVNH